MVNINIRKAAVSAAIVLGAQALVVQPASAAELPFNGTWTSVDTDGSSQVLTVRGQGAGSRAVALFDDAATVCGGVPASVTGSAVIDGSLMILHAPISCRPGGNPVSGRVEVAFLYDEATDTLNDPSGVVWHRSN